MKKAAFPIIGAAILLYLYFEKQKNPGVTPLPINPDPTQQAVFNSLLPNVDLYGNIVNPAGLPDSTSVTSQITGWELLPTDPATTSLFAGS